MGLCAVLRLDYGLKVHLSYSLRQPDDGLELPHGNRDAVGLLGYLLLLAGGAICHIHVLEHVSSLLTQAREDFRLSVGQILLE